MSAPPARRLPVERRSTWFALTVHRAPRILVLAAVVILSLGGLRALLHPPRAAPPAVRPAPVGDLTEETYAEAFVRAYLTWDAADPDGYQRKLATYLGPAAADGGSAVTPSASSRSVSWTEALEDAPAGPDRRSIVVEADTSAGTVYVDVTVARGAAGFIHIATYPALVGPPATDPQAEAPAESDITDAGLAAVLRRAVTNYVEGQAADLRADLTADAVVSLPPAPLSVRSIDRLSWAPSGRAAVELTAVGPDRTEWTLRYELGVREGDRWYVTAIAADPAPKEGSR